MIQSQQKLKLGVDIGFTDMIIRVQQHNDTEWTATKATFSYGLVGYGSTMIEAICDLNRKLAEEECLMNDDEFRRLS